MSENIANEKLFAPIAREAAPEALLPVLERVENIFGFIPNLMGALAKAPAAAKGYHVLLAVSIENNGLYCTAAHSAAAKPLAKVPREVIGAIHGGHTLSDPKLNALVWITREIVRDRGYIKSETMQAFVSAGYRKEQVMEILLGVAGKTLSNSTSETTKGELQ